jgi:hypothetical protein
MTDRSETSLFPDRKTAANAIRAVSRILPTA